MTETGDLMILRKFMSLIIVGCILVSLSSCTGIQTIDQLTTTHNASSYPSSSNQGNVNPAGMFPIAKDKVTIRLAVPQSQFIKDYDTNYYTKWLEDKANVNLIFEILPSGQAVEKAQLIMASMNNMPDGFCGLSRITNGASIFSTSNIMKYGLDGQILALNDLIGQYGYEINILWDRYRDQHLKQSMTSADGNIYYMPGFGATLIGRYFAKFFVNKDWLETLDLDQPQTTEAFYSMLKAFLEQDPNQNGQQDEIPLTGSPNGVGTDAYEYILNAFVSNNARNGRFYSDDGQIIFAPATDAWREGLKYLNKLTQEGLLDDKSFFQDETLLKQIVNDPNNILGGFVSFSISAVVQANNLDVLSRYVGLAPIAGPEGVQFSMTNDNRVSADGFIAATSSNAAVVFRLFDLMLSYDASMISRFGIENENWVKAESRELNYYGEPASLRIIKDIWGTPQNINWMNYCPHVNDIHSDNIAWDGDTTKPQYINAQTALLYQQYEPPISMLVPQLVYRFEDSDSAWQQRAAFNTFVKATVAQFSIGERDPRNDADWQEYLSQLDNMGLAHYLEITQQAYDDLE